jgi:Fic family protein
MRRTEAHTVPEARSTPALRRLVQRIEAEFREMPGLELTAQQAQRLWALDTATCGAVLGVLSERGFLRRTAGGSYLREHPG